MSVADFDFDKAIDAHRQWKVKLRAAIAERGHLDADTICKDDQCPLGKWIHGEGGKKWSHKPRFVELTRCSRRPNAACERIERGAPQRAAASSSRRSRALKSTGLVR